MTSIVTTSESKPRVETKIDQLVHKVESQEKNALDTVFNTFADMGAVISLNILSLTGSYTLVPESVMCLLRRRMPSVARIIGGVDSYRRDVYLGMGVILLPLLLLSGWCYKRA